MSRAPEQPVDPLRWCGALALAFWLATLPFLTVVPHAYFDEVHYLPAARELLVLGEFTNREHPLVGKELIALGIALFGDNPWGWRLLPTMFGTLALFANMRTLWFATCSRFATLTYGVLLATGFHLFVHARIAMLDIFYLAFLSVAAWQFAAAVRQPEQGRWRLALTGIALGLAMGSKWNALVVATLPGLTFLIARALAGRRRLLLSRRGAPVSGSEGTVSIRSTPAPSRNATPSASAADRNTAPTSAPRTASNGTDSCPTTVTSFPRAANDEAASIPMNDAPMTATDSASPTRSMSARASFQVRRRRTPSRSAPSRSSRRGTPPVATRAAS